MNETVTAFLKVSHNLVRTGMYSFIFVRLGIMSRGPERTFQGAVYGPRAVVCSSLIYDVRTTTKLSNNAFIRTYPRRLATDDSSPYVIQTTRVVIALCAHNSKCSSE